jgi:hypothetical protein
MTDRRHRRGRGSRSRHEHSQMWMAQVRVGERRISKYFVRKPPPKPWKRNPWPLEIEQWISDTLARDAHFTAP